MKSSTAAQSIWIVDYYGGKATKHGPWSAVSFDHVNVSVPQTAPVTITFRVETDEGATDYLTVSTVHTITTDA